MPKIRKLKTKYTSGELDLRLIARMDTRHLEEGAAVMRNVLLLTQGGWVRRPGFEHQDVHASYTQDAIIRRFVFNKDQQYLVMFKHNQICIYRNDGGSAVLQATITSPYTAAQLRDVFVTQEGDTMVIFHPDVEPRVLTRGGSHTSWNLNTWGAVNIPFYPFAATTSSTPAGTITPSAVSGTITITASAAGTFNSSHVGQYLQGNGGYVRIIQFISGTQVRGVAEDAFFDTTAIANPNWQLITGYEAAMSASRGWPNCGMLYRQALWLGGTKSLPNTIFRSKIGQFFDFNLGRGLADEGIMYQADGTPDPILTIYVGRHLLFFSSAREFFVPANRGASITPETFSIEGTTENGSRAVAPISVDGTILYVNRAGNSIHSAVYNDLEQSYIAPSVTTLSPHLIRKPVDMALLRPLNDESANYVLVVNEDGTLAVLNTLRSEEINGWTMQETAGTIISVAIMDDTPYFLVRRTINGVASTYLERWNWDLWLDSGVRKTGAAATTWAGFGHLNGQTSRVITDGYMHPNRTPLAGSITLTSEATEVQVGLTFLAKTTTMPNNVDFGTINTYSRPRRMIRADLEMYRTRDFIVQVKNDEKTYRPSLQNYGSTIYNGPAQAYTGQVQVWLGGVDNTAQLTITQEEPLPLGCLGVNLEVEYS